jgi:hypothetical protein
MKTHYLRLFVKEQDVSPTLHMVTMLYYYITDNQERQTLNLPDLLQHKIVFKVFSDTIVLPVPSQTILNNVFSFCSNFNEIYLESTTNQPDKSTVQPVL